MCRADYCASWLFSGFLPKSNSISFQFTSLHICYCYLFLSFLEFGCLFKGNYSRKSSIFTVPSSSGRLVSLVKKKKKPFISTLDEVMIAFNNVTV